METVDLKRIQCVAGRGRLASSSFEEFAVALCGLPALRRLVIGLSVIKPKVTVRTPQHLARCLAVDTLAVDLPPSTPSRFQSVLDLCSDELQTCSMYLEHPELLNSSPLNRFSNLRTLRLRLRADSPAVLYNLCRKTAALPQVTRLTVTKFNTLGSVDTGMDD